MNHGAVFSRCFSEWGEMRTRCQVSTHPECFFPLCGPRGFSVALNPKHVNLGLTHRYRLEVQSILNLKFAHASQTSLPVLLTTHSIVSSQRILFSSNHQSKAKINSVGPLPVVCLGRQYIDCHAQQRPSYAHLS